MKKNWIAIAIALLAFAYPASAWLIGRNVESTLVRNSERMLASAPYMKVIKRNFQGGVFSSTEDTTIEIAGDLFRSLAAMQETPKESPGEPSDANEPNTTADEPAAISSEPIKPITIRVLSKVKHGPFAGSGLALAKVDTEILFDEKLQQEISKAFAAKKPLELTTTMNWAGGGTTLVSSPAANVSIQQGAGTLSWRGLQGKIDFTKDMASYRSDLTSEGFEFTGGPKKETVKIGAMHILSNKKRLNDTSIFYFGKDNGTIKEMSFSSASDPGKAFTLKDITYLADMSEAAGFSDMTAKMGADKLLVGTDGYGPAHYDFSIKHMHTPTLEKFIKAFGEIYSGKHKTPEEMTAASLAPWKQYVPDLLKNNPELIIDRISFTTTEGEAMFKGNVKIPGATAEDFANPLGMIGKVNAAFDIAIPEALVMKLSGAGKQTDEEKAAAAEMMQQQLQGVEQQGYITREGKILKSHFEWKAGKGTINGKPFAMPGAPPPQE
jgi:uncharacterized protein YdgA (DUF945 family)